MTGLARTLIGLGIGLILTGLLVYALGKLTVLGRLPGDITYRKGNFTFYFPLGTCVLISLISTLLFNLFGRK